MRFRCLILFFCLLCYVGNAALAKHKSHARKRTQRSYAQAVSPIYGENNLAYQLGTLINASNTRADVAVYVKSMANAQSLYAYNISKPFTPASTLKILTAEAALLYLGPQYRFSTQLLTDAKGVKNGVLQGNLYVVLSGDPTLTYFDLIDLLDALRSEQIRGIAGNVYIDNTAYDQSFYGPGWVWQDRGYCYAAPISASIINHNCLSFKVKTPKKYAQPKRKNPKFAKTSRRRACALRLTRSPGSLLSIDNCGPNSQYVMSVGNVVTDVPEYNRTLFKYVLSRLSITVYGSVTFGSAPPSLSLIDSHNSKPLTVLVNEMLKKSDNVIAGALFKKLGQMYTRQPGSWANGSLAVSQILSKRAGVNIAGMRILDGSGLSPDNLATPAQMMQVLDFAYHHDATREDFISSLPVAGVDGTLKHRLKNIARKARAKTGTISGVASLAGYVDTRDKELLAFVIMINGHKGYGWRYKALEDKLVTALTRFKRNG